MNKRLALTILVDDEDILLLLKNKKKKRRYIYREREKFAQIIYNDYFSPSPTYPPDYFKRRWRMSKYLFEMIRNKICEFDSFFVQKNDALGRPGLTPEQKIFAALDQICRGVPCDAVDNYCRCSESVARLCLINFVKDIIHLFKGEYMRSPTKLDIEKELATNKKKA